MSDFFQQKARATNLITSLGAGMTPLLHIGCIQILFENVTKSVDVDFVDLNLLARKAGK